MTTTTTPAIQTLTIPNWHPKTSPNNQRRHWRDVQKNHHADRDMAWVSAMQARWEFVPGKVRLTITLVYPRTYRVDADNLAARCKGILDGLKSHQESRGSRNIRAVDLPVRHGFFEDDSTDVLTLDVRAEVVKGVKETRIVLEALE